jgi:hypothetical protein
MAGGSFQVGEKKVRPGMYINFKALAQDRLAVSPRGTVVIPLTLNWGENGVFHRIEVEADTMDKLGYDFSDPEMLLIREAKKKAKAVLIWKLNTGTAATGSFGTTSVCTVTAKQTGTRGNDISVTSQTNVLDATKKDVITYVAGRQVDKQTAANIQDLTPNAWVTFSGTGAIELTAGTTLTGGANGTVLNADYTDFMEACETEFFDTIAFPVSDSTLKSTFAGFIRRLREDEGKKVQGVVANYSADYEGIINVKNGVKLIDGTTLTPEKCTAWVAGATAGASVVTSNTYMAYQDAVDVVPRYTNTQIIDALKAGEFVFVFDGNKVKVEQDINSLVTLGPDKNRRFQKNRPMRVLDAIGNDVKGRFDDNYLGKVGNNQDGRSLFKGDVIDYLETLQKGGAIQNLDKDKDFVYDEELCVGEDVYAEIGVQPVDSMEKAYFTVKVR